VTPHVLRHVRPGGRVNVWNPPAKLRIANAASAGGQVLLSLSSGELVYFELDAQAGVLLELERLDAGAAGVTCLALAPPEAGARSRWAAYADGEGRLR
jgi:splicing factor 3B subunit 3